MERLCLACMVDTGAIAREIASVTYEELKVKY